MGVAALGTRGVSRTRGDEERMRTSGGCLPWAEDRTGAGCGSDGAHGGERPWFKKWTGQRRGVEKRRVLLIVVADHGKSGEQIPDPGSGPRSRTPASPSRSSARLNEYIPAFPSLFLHFSGPSFEGRPGVVTAPRAPPLAPACAALRRGGCWGRRQSSPRARRSQRRGWARCTPRRLVVVRV